jgi:hypothetical protein
MLRPARRAQDTLPDAGEAKFLKPDAKSSRRFPSRISKMKVHPEICMKTKDEDKMSFGEQAWMLARCKGEADCA